MPHTTLNGHQLFYREQGIGSLVIILPGNTASSAWHERELVEFGKRFHAVALDPLGTGQSERVETWPEDWWQQVAQDALALIPALGEKQAVLVGTSGGAVAALRAAIHDPARVRAVIADSLTETLRPEDLRGEVLSRKQKTPGQVDFWSRAHGPDWEQVVESDNRILLAFAEQGGDWFGGKLKEIRCPVLLTGSLQDDLLKDVGEQVPRMAVQIPECEVFLGNGGYHPFMWSRPDAFHSAAAAFLKRVY